MRKTISAISIIIILSSIIGIANSQTEYISPLKQFKTNHLIDKITCPSNLELIMKKTDGSPACVKNTTVAILIERGWGIHVLADYTKNGTKNSDMFYGGQMNINTEYVNYFQNTTGFIAKPSQDGSFPGVILIHEWWGLNDNIKSMARGLASHGYNVIAVDLYAGQVATTADGARKLMLSFDKDTGIANLKSAEDLLIQKYNSSKIATIGWCFGGSQSLNYAVSGNKVDATVIYYGQPVTDKDELSKITWPVLGFYGDEDQSIPIEKINDFKVALDDQGIKNTINIYQGLGHAFANPSGPNYAPKQTMDSWNKTLVFLDENLKQ